MFHTYQPSRDLTYYSGIEGFIKNSCNLRFLYQRTDHIVDIHNIYEINLIPN